MAKRKKPGQPAEGSPADEAARQPLDVVLSLAPEPPAIEPPQPAPPEPQPSLATSAMAFVLPDETVFEAPDFGTEAQRGLAPRPARRLDRLARWFSPRRVWLLVLGLALLLLALLFSAWSDSAAGVIYPDWGLAGLRIGFVAVLLGAVLLLLFLVIWQARVRPLPAAGGVLGLVLLVIGAGGVFGAAPLHRLQGLWFEARGQYGLAQVAYAASGDSLAQSQDLARITVEWAEQLSDQHQYGEAVAQLAPVVRFYTRDAALASRARRDLIQDYLAWGDQASQQGAFSAALARYRALQAAAYCDANCQMQVHERSAQALLGLARQLTADKQYDKAVATYQEIVQNYSDTPEEEEASLALTAPQMLTGRLVYANQTPAQHFQVLLASRWSFNASTQVFTLLGQEYRAQTDANGFFVVPSVAVGPTYMIAWIDTSGHAGTCYTTNNQPLYTVEMRPLRAADAGSINIECV